MARHCLALPTEPGQPPLLPEVRELYGAESVVVPTNNLIWVRPLFFEQEQHAFGILFSAQKIMQLVFVQFIFLCFNWCWKQDTVSKMHILVNPRVNLQDGVFFRRTVWLSSFLTLLFPEWEIISLFFSSALSQKGFSLYHMQQKNGAGPLYLTLAVSRAIWLERSPKTIIIFHLHQERSKCLPGIRSLIVLN